MSETSDPRPQGRRPFRALQLVFRRLRQWFIGRRPDQGSGQGEDLRERTAEVQLGLIREAFGKDEVGSFWGKRAERDGFYLYRPREVLLMADDVNSIDSFFRERQRDYREGGTVVEELPGGLVRYELPGRRDGRDDLPSTLDELDASGREGMARPDHVVYVTPNGWGSLCPANEPELPLGKGALPPLTRKRALGDGVRVSVVDTGRYEAAETNPDSPWLAGNIEGDLETVDPADIHPYAGHGSFIAGIIRCLAPATYIEIEGVLTKAGAVYESEIAKELNEALSDPDKPQLISISAGTHTRKNLGLIGFEALAGVYDLAEGEQGPLVVAAAGNDSSKRPFWPAAYPWVLSVGALDEDMCVSDFSNYGDWVDVYAHGRDLVNAFPTGTYTCYEPAHLGEVRSFTGLAQWSGTSFATPVVTGLIAAYMSEHQVSAREARDALIAASLHVTDPAGLTRPVVGPPFV